MIDQVCTSWCWLHWGGWAGVAGVVAVLALLVAVVTVADIVARQRERAARSFDLGLNWGTRTRRVRRDGSAQWEREVRIELRPMGANPMYEVEFDFGSKIYVLDRPPAIRVLCSDDDPVVAEVVVPCQDSPMTGEAFAEIWWLIETPHGLRHAGIRFDLETPDRRDAATGRVLSPDPEILGHFPRIGPRLFQARGPRWRPSFRASPRDDPRRGR